MNMMKRCKALLLAAAMVCLTLALAACGGETAESGEAAYKVTVADAAGNPYTSGVVVRFLQNGEQKAMQVVNDRGVAEKTLPKGDYTVELTFTGDASGYHYEQEGLTLTAKRTELTVTLSYAVDGGKVSLFAGGEDVGAYHVGEGSTHVQLEDGARNYFLFAPTRAGTYRFSTDNASGVIGYYGAPHFVQEHSAAEVVDNAFTVSVSASMIGTGDTGSTVIVIGIDAEGIDSCTLNVERIGDPAHTLADEPWMIYEKTVELSQYTLPAGAVLGEFDLTSSGDAYQLVLNEKDGFYHLDTADGPLVLVRLGEDSEYLASFKTILENSGVVKYFFDENDEFVRKESYSECLLEYIEYMDEDYGVYPLTEDLKYIIQQRGEYSGWWEEGGSLYLFKDVNGIPVPGINPEIAWLFMCCYIQG